jgi:hypothetical protein
VFGGARHDRRRKTAQRLNILLIDGVGAFRQLAHHLQHVHIAVAAQLQRARVDLVVDVGDVAHIGDVLRAVQVAQQAEQHVEHDGRPRITDMRVVVNRRPAHIRAHVVGIEWLERLFRARQRVVQAKAHAGTAFLRRRLGFPP